MKHEHGQVGGLGEENCQIKAGRLLEIWGWRKGTQKVQFSIFSLGTDLSSQEKSGDSSSSYLEAPHKTGVPTAGENSWRK